MSIEITLTRGQVSIVCDCHASLIKSRKWYAMWNPTSHQFYAARGTSIAERLAGAPKTIMMHAVINGTPRGIGTDHINSNALDNRCVNLRTATAAENGHNRGKTQLNTSGYKGVYWHKINARWMAIIGINGHDKYLGCFDTAEAAAYCYDAAARELYGDFVRTNFPAKSVP